MKALYKQIERRRQEDGLSSNAGFTLIELLIVIVVLGILAGVVIFALGGVTGKSAVAACQADGATVSTAISAFNAQNPGTTVTMGVTGSNGGLLGNGSGTGDVGGPYLQSWPSNLPHYAYAIADGTTVYTGTTAPAGTLLIDVQKSSGTSYGNVTGLPSDLWNAYTGPTSCKNVQ